MSQQKKAPSTVLKRFFPTFLWQRKLSVSKSFITSLADECYAFERFDLEGRKWSKENYVKGYTSYSSIADLHLRSSSFRSLKEKLDDEVKKFSQALEIDLKGRRLEMSSFWINIMGQYAHHSFHLHPLSTISGTFYLKVPSGSGALKIEDPRISAFMGSPPRKCHYELNCKAGEVILFESWLKHEVPANKSKEDRISVSFNYDWV